MVKSKVADKAGHWLLTVMGETKFDVILDILEEILGVDTVTPSAADEPITVPPKEEKRRHEFEKGEEGTDGAAKEKIKSLGEIVKEMLRPKPTMGISRE